MLKANRTSADNQFYLRAILINAGGYEADCIEFQLGNFAINWQRNERDSINSDTAIVSVKCSLNQ